MGFISKLFGGGKKSTPKQAPAAPAPPPDRNLAGAIAGAGAPEGSNVLSAGNTARSTFLGG